MKIEEAIRILEKQFDKSCSATYQNTAKLDFEEALYTAVTVLRAQTGKERAVGIDGALGSIQANGINRLTKNEKRTNGFFEARCAHFSGWECYVRNGNCSDGCSWGKAVWERLSAYEDIGLTPEEVGKLAAQKGNAK